MKKFVLFFILPMFVLSNVAFSQNQIKLAKNSKKFKTINVGERIVVQFVSKEKPKWYYKTPLLYRKVVKKENVTFITGRILEIGINDFTVETSRKDKFLISADNVIAIGKSNRISKTITSGLGVLFSCHGSLFVMLETGWALGAGAFVAGVSIVGLINKAVFPVHKVNKYGKRWKMNINPVENNNVALMSTGTRSSLNKGV